MADFFKAAAMLVKISISGYFKTELTVIRKMQLPPEDFNLLSAAVIKCPDSCFKLKSLIAEY